MEHSAEIFVNADPTTVAEIVSDLSTYPEWNDVVASAVADDHGDEAAWLTTLRARVGPFARSKQLRMARTLHTIEDDTHEIRIERVELDGREHASWVMNASVAPEGDGSRVVLGLEYTGGLWTPGLDIVLGTAIERATRNLSEYLTSQGAN